MMMKETYFDYRISVEKLIEMGVLKKTARLMSYAEWRQKTYVNAVEEYLIAEWNWTAFHEFFYEDCQFDQDGDIIEDGSPEKAHQRYSEFLDFILDCYNKNFDVAKTAELANRKMKNL